MMLVSFVVKTSNRDYPVCIGENILLSIGESFSETADRVFVVTDEKVAKIHLESLIHSLSKSGIEAIAKVLSAGENVKSLSSAEELYNFLLENKASRFDIILALGGGVIGDLVGFVASTYKRGMRFIQAPTTLLSQVDSALGGKTGVNLPGGKNLVGTFYQPIAVVADVSLLKTLPKDDFASGLAEVIKYGAIMDKELLGFLTDNRGAILRREPDILSLIVERCLRNKARIVEEDEREEERKRAVLNYGHTIGHAIETCSGNKIPHGHAVAIGMVEEARFAVREGLLDNQSLQSLISLLSLFGLPTSIPTDVDLEGFEHVIKQDKKVRQDQLLLPVLIELGSAKLKMVGSLQTLVPKRGGEQPC